MEPTVITFKDAGTHIDLGPAEIQIVGDANFEPVTPGYYLYFSNSPLEVEYNGEIKIVGQGAVLFPPWIKHRVRPSKRMSSMAVIRVNSQLFERDAAWPKYIQLSTLSELDAWSGNLIAAERQGASSRWNGQEWGYTVQDGAVIGKTLVNPTNSFALTVAVGSQLKDTSIPDGVFSIFIVFNECRLRYEDKEEMKEISIPDYPAVVISQPWLAPLLSFRGPVFSFRIVGTKRVNL